MAEYTATVEQTVNPGETVNFTAITDPCRRGFVRHADETGNFLLSGWLSNRNNSCNCCCSNQRSANYFCDFSCDIAVATGGTAGEITVAFVVDGSTVPSSTMTATPAAVEEFWNVSKAKSVPVWRGCCETVSIRNTSDQPILVRNAVLVITRPDLSVTY